MYRTSTRPELHPVDSRRSTCPPSASNSNDAAFSGWVALFDQNEPAEWYAATTTSTRGGGLTLTVSGKAGTVCFGGSPHVQLSHRA